MSRRDHPDLYETDFIAWAERQASALRAIPYTSPFGLDLPNLIGEVEALARRDLIEFQDRVRSALTGLLIAAREPDPGRARVALSSVTGPLIEARSLQTPTGVSRLDPDQLWSEAWEEASTSLPPAPVLGAPGPCPFRAEELLARGFSPADGVERVRWFLSGR